MSNWISEHGIYSIGGLIIWCSFSAGGYMWQQVIFSVAFFVAMAAHDREIIRQQKKGRA